VTLPGICEEPIFHVYASCPPLPPAATAMTVKKVKLAVLPQLIPEKLSGVTVVVRFVTFRGVRVGDGDCETDVGIELGEALVVLPHPADPNTTRTIVSSIHIRRFSILDSPGLQGEDNELSCYEPNS